MIPEDNKLDNPAWHSLTEIHWGFAIDYGGVKFYHPDHCPFGGFVNPEKIFESIDAYSALIHNFFVIGEKPFFSDRLMLTKNLVCRQMLLEIPADIEISEPIIELQSSDHKKDLFALVNLVQPGYFRNKTSELGSYYGIYKNNSSHRGTHENEFVYGSKCCSDASRTYRERLCKTTDCSYNQ